MLQGDTRNIPLQNIFQTLDLNQQEGILTIQFEKLERFIAIRSGGIGFLTETAYGSRLLQQALAKLKILTPNEYQNVFATATAQTPPGDLLLSRHLLQPAHASGPLREQFLEFLYEIFAWQGVRYRFEVQPIGPDRVIFGGELGAMLLFPVNAILMEVARREDEWERIREVLPSPNQIYRFTRECNHQSLPTDLDPERFAELTRLLNGERTLEDVIEESSAPPFYVFSALRALISEDFAEPIPIAEKRTLVDRLRLQLPVEKLAGLYESILDDDPSDLETRRKLVGFLEKSEAQPAVLLPHYRLLAAASMEMGDQSSTRDYLLKVVALDPRDLDCLEQLTLIELESKRDKEWQQILRSYVEAIRKHREYERGAEFLLDLVETRPAEAGAIHEAAHLYLLAGRPKDAAVTYERAAKIYLARREFSRLNNVVEKLEVCDSRSAARWRKHVATTGRKKPRAAIGAKLALVAAIAMVGAVVAFVVYEWDARSAYAQILESAQRRAHTGDMNGALADLEEFRRSYGLSLVAQTVGSDIRRIERAANENQRPKDPPRSMENVASIERLISKAASLKGRGKYVEALEVYETIDTETLPKAFAQNVESDRNFLQKYMEEADRLDEAGEQAEEQGDYSQASTLRQQLIDRFRYSPAASRARIPVLIEVLPPEATVRVGTEPLEGPPYVLRAVSGDAPRVTVEAPSFEPRTLVVEPRQTWTVDIQLQKQPRWIRIMEAPVETEPIAFGGIVFVGTRSGKVVALDDDTGAIRWESALEGLGDPLGAIRRRADDIVFTGTDRGLYRVAGSTGERRYRLPFPEGSGYARVPMTAPDPDGRTYVITTRGEMLAFDIDEPKLLWRQRIGGSGHMAPARIANLVLVATSDGLLVALDGISGRVLWKVGLQTRVTTTPGGNDQLVVLGTGDHKIHALSPLNGSIQWSLELDGAPCGRVVVDGTTAAVLSDTGHLTSIDLESRARRWQMESGASFRFEPILDEGLLFTIDEQGMFRTYRADTGKMLWSYESSSRPGSLPAVSAQHFIISNLDNRLHVIGRGKTQ